MNVVLETRASGLSMSRRRYMWVLFPAFIVLARWGERPGFDRLITTVSLLLLALLTALFANGYWGGEFPGNGCEESGVGRRGVGSGYGSFRETGC